MANSKIAEAIVLFDNGYNDAAYYLCGYAVEFALKSAICNRLGVEMFESVAEIKEVAKSFKIHRLRDLLILSSLKPTFEENRSEDEELSGAWSLVVEWNEQKRYQDDCPQEAAREFIGAVKIFLIWIKKYW